MKFISRKSVWRIGGTFLPLLIALLLSPLVVLGTDPIYINTGTINNSNLPQIDATNFYNSGTWDISTVQYPYQTADTQNYTNTGTMTGSVGWEFDFGPATSGGPRTMSASFFNDSRGTITAVDGEILNPINSQYPSTVSYLLISATNIVNKGTLVGDVGGIMALTGQNVSLARSTLQIGSGAASITPQCSENDYTLTNYSAAGAIYDYQWETNGVTMNSSNLWTGAATSPNFLVNEPCGLSNQPAQITVSAGVADSISIVAGYTNIVVTNMDHSVTTNNEPAQIFRQAVFIGDNNISSIVPDDRFFANSDNISNLFETITVSLTCANSGGSLYLVDSFAAKTNHEYLQNITVTPGSSPVTTCTDPTYRPGNYWLDRADSCYNTFADGSPGLGVPAANFFYDQDFSNVVVQTTYSAYSAYVDDLVRNPPGGTVSNLPGRIVITATNLDLTKTTINNQGAEIEIQANNFEGSTGAVVSCQNLSYNLGSAVGNLNVTNLASDSTVPGLYGTVSAWSAVWTNGLITGIFTNWSFGTNSDGSPNSTNNVITNIAEVDFNVLLVDATELSSTVPVTVQDLILQSTNMLVSDSMNVVNTLLFGGQSLTLQGTLDLSGNLQNWNSSITPTWLYFTNNGTLSVPQDAHFGDDGPTNYAAFVNNGAISVGGGETINSVYYQSSGNETAPGGYFVTTPNGKIENAKITSGQDMDFSGGVLKLSSSTLSAGNQFNFNLTNALYDSGGSAGNTLTCGNGFNLPVKPATGDLLGTAITSDAFDGAEVDYVWAGVDRGSATTAGYSNNVALGTLVLSPQGSSSFPALFYFSGASVNNGLYVDLLDLSQITNVPEMLATDPNLVIYYAAAKLPATVTVQGSNGQPQQEVETNIGGLAFYVRANGGSGQVPQEPEEVLNGQLNGHLLWVTNFAGPNSSVDVIINGQTVLVNKALRYSMIIDSNGNGIPNYYDPNPFNTIPLVLTASLIQTNPPPAQAFAISWMAQTNMPYQVQYKTSLFSTNWLPLLNYTNTAPTNTTVTVWDTNTLPSQRFYRVSHP